jgi:single-strand DNA-binding protein
MSGSINKVILVGNVGRDPEIRSMNSGDRVCNLSLATSERWKDRNTGDQQERTEWHRVVIFDQKLVDVCEKYVKKGSKLFIEGQLQTRKWTDQQGVEKYSTEVVLQRFRGELTMLDSRDSGGGGYDAEQAGDPGYGQSAMATAGGNNGNGSGSDLDDEIPF